WRLKLKNKENLLIKNTILVANHQSYLDILWILGFIPYKQRKDVYIIGKKELSFLELIFPGIRTIFVDRGADVYPALKAGADVLRKGKSLFVFPEGTRTKSGALGEFKSGSMFLSYNLKKNIIPITVKGAYDIFPPDKKFPRLSIKQPPAVIVHPRVQPENYKSVDELTKATRKIIEKGLT
ncbi:MAG: 1-acyl-sn-glycerol-3-phosphate acyltransferase, partial [Spirochaetales bacterium]|nr:1-acyl-sn-glycerol-3-phosphate acyltransferase [Spirochaetales bacterium]